MSPIQLTELVTYPLKSAKGNYREQMDVTFRGLKYDRNWAIVDESNNVITSRDFPLILSLKCEVINNILTIENASSLHTSKFPENAQKETIMVFNEKAEGVLAEASTNKWLSAYLGIDCQLTFMAEDSLRPVLKQYGGRDGDLVGYADECPLLLISEASLNDLNTKLESPVSIAHFRPNIVVDGTEPYCEDQWKKIRIGDCEFDIVQQCKRCVFITIDPETGQKNPKQEPLRTLAQYRKHPKGGVAFGVHLVPTKLGNIKKGDSIEVIS